MGSICAFAGQVSEARRLVLANNRAMETKRFMGLLQSF
jgi:hypothetical protein